MNTFKLGDVLDEYIIIGPHKLSELKKLGIHQLVIEKLQTRKFVDLKNEIFEINEIDNLTDLELLTDLYVGTIFNACPEKVIVEHVFEMELPESFIPFSLQFNRYTPVLKWQDYYFNATVSKYNQLIISCIGKTPPSTDELCFCLTAKI